MKKHYKLLKALAVASVMMTAKLSAQVPVYCTSNLGGANCNDWITNVTILGTALNNTSACSFGSNGTYSSFSPGPGTTCNLTAGLTYSMSITTNASNIESFWIDYNQDGTFSSTEWVQPTTNSTANAATVASFTVPANAVLGPTGLRVRSRDFGNQNGASDACTTFGSGETEDYVVTIISSVPCSGTPGANSVLTPTYQICPNGTAPMGLTTSYTVGGLTYQWLASTSSSVGPFLAVSGATNSFYSATNQTVSSWYKVVITCSASTASVAATPGAVTVAAVSTSVVPYFEGFENIPFNNSLPNCSWSASNIPGVTQTYTGPQNANRQPHTGNKFAAFYMYLTNGSYYFYSNGIQLNTGITYSASVWFTTEYYGYTNVTDLSLMLGPNQTTTGLVTIASDAPAASPVYKSLSNTFTVASSGIYYLAVRATGNGNYGVNYLSWDDLAIIAPCSLNSPTLSLSANTQTICKGDAINLTASGADTYTWSTGANGSSITDMPGVNTVYHVVGTNTLSGCSVTVQSQMVIVNSVPNIVAYANKPVLCAGESANLTVSGSGANSYTWNTSSNNAIITVTPNTTTTYTVLASGANNCMSTVTVQILVNPSPTVSITSGAPDPNQMCKGESVTLTGNGALTYEWASNAVFISSSPAIVHPNVTTTFTLFGTDANGCQGKSTITLNVSDCTGINEVTTTLSGVKVYPNPTAGIFTIELNTTSAKVIQVIDLTGRVILTSAGNNEKINVNLGSFANGIYYVKIQSDKAVEVIKVVKQ